MIFLIFHCFIFANIFKFKCPHTRNYSRTGEENILPVVACGFTLGSYTRPLRIDIRIGVTESSGRKMGSGVAGDRMRLSLLYRSSPPHPEMKVLQ